MKEIYRWENENFRILIKVFTVAEILYFVYRVILQ